MNAQVSFLVSFSNIMCHSSPSIFPLRTRTATRERISKESLKCGALNFVPLQCCVRYRRRRPELHIALGAKADNDTQNVLVLADLCDPIVLLN